MDILEFKNLFSQRPYFFVFELPIHSVESYVIEQICQRAVGQADGVILKTMFGHNTDQVLIETAKSIKESLPDLLVGITFHQHDKEKKTTRNLLENGFDLAWGFETNDPRPEGSRKNGLYIGELHEPIWNKDKTHRWAKRIAQSGGIYSLALRDYDGEKYVSNFNRFIAIRKALGNVPLFLADSVNLGKVKKCLNMIEGMIDLRCDFRNQCTATSYTSRRRVREMSRTIHGSA
jgi:hypothetical protein